MREINFEIPIATPMLNTYLGWHWTKRSKHTKLIATLVRSACKRAPKEPFKKCIIIIERHKGPSACGYPIQDWDGLLGGMKGLFDSITEKSKYGMGLIEDDNTDCIISTPTIIRVKAPKGTEKTVVRIIEVDSESDEPLLSVVPS